VLLHGFLAEEMAIMQRVVQQKNKIETKKEAFKKNVHLLTADQVAAFKVNLTKMKEEFAQCRGLAKGSRIRLKEKAAKAVQARNEGLKRKALGRPAIDPRLIKKKKTIPSEDNAPPLDEQPKIIFPSSMTA
jgi:hypothetical protein